jgi:hypothetical protein
VLYQPLMTRCPETNAMVFSTPPEVQAELDCQAGRDADHQALKALLGQVLAALPEAVQAGLDPTLVASLVPARAPTPRITPRAGSSL